LARELLSHFCEGIDNHIIFTQDHIHSFSFHSSSKPILRPEGPKNRPFSHVGSPVIDKVDVILVIVVYGAKIGSR
jgi:hypothetical protein